MNSLITRYHDWSLERPDRMALYKALFGLVVPIAIQNLLASLVNSADILMLNYVGQDELAAVSLANQYMFLLWGFFFGINSASTLMNSQYWGKGDTRAVHAVLGISFKLCLILTFCVTLATVLIPEQLMTLYTGDATLIKIGAAYLRTIGISYTIMSFSQAYMCTLRSVEQAAKSTIISTITLACNIALNAVFIFGLFGMPKLGVVGVAIATTISRVLELVICIADYVMGSMFKPDLRLLFGRHPLLQKDFVQYAVPAIANDLIWTLAFSTFSIILGHMNNDIVAASSVATTLRDLFTTVCFGLSAGGSVLLGKEMGSGDLKRAKKDAGRLCHMILLLTAVMGLFIVLLRHPLIGLFDLTDQARRYLDIMMLISGYYVIGQAINTLCIAGIFRAGGNTRFGLYCDLVCMWCISVPLGFISAFALKLPPMVVYFILCLDEFWKLPAVYIYYKGYKWLNNITKDGIV